MTIILIFGIMIHEKSPYEKDNILNIMKALVNIMIIHLYH